MKSIAIALFALCATGPLTLPAAAQDTDASETDAHAKRVEARRIVVQERQGELGTIRIPRDQWVARLDSGFPAPIALFSGHLFEAETVLEHATAIELTADQRRRIIDIAAESQADATRQRLEYRGTGDQLDKLLMERPIDATAALGALDRILEAEDVQKRQQLASLIAVRNTLTEAQIEKLQELRHRSYRVEFIERDKPLERILEEVGE